MVTTTSKYLVYGLVDPRTEKVRYIGKSARGDERIKCHGRQSYLNDNTNRAKWILGLKRKGLTFQIKILEECQSEAEALEKERQWISEARAMGWKLTNHTSGGETVTFDEITLRKMSKAGKGKPKSPAHRAKISASLKGRVMSPEWKAKVCGDNSPMKRKEVRDKRAATMNKVRETDPDRYSAASRATWTEEKRKKFAEAQSGDSSFTKRPEVRAKISASQKARHAKRKGEGTTSQEIKLNSTKRKLDNRRKGIE